MWLFFFKYCVHRITWHEITFNVFTLSRLLFCNWPVPNIKCEQTISISTWADGSSSSRLKDRKISELSLVLGRRQNGNLKSSLRSNLSTHCPNLPLEDKVGIWDKVCNIIPEITQHSFHLLYYKAHTHIQSPILWLLNL